MYIQKGRNIFRRYFSIKKKKVKVCSGSSLSNYEIFEQFIQTGRLSDKKFTDSELEEIGKDNEIIEKEFGLI